MYWVVMAQYIKKTTTVIPALIAYVKVVAVKTLVVGARPSETRVRNQVSCSGQERAGY